MVRSTRICAGDLRETYRQVEVFQELGSGESFGFIEDTTWTTPSLIRPADLAVGTTWSAGAVGEVTNGEGEVDIIEDDTPFEVVEDGVEVTVAGETEQALRIRRNPGSERSSDSLFVPGIGPVELDGVRLLQYVAE